MKKRRENVADLLEATAPVGACLEWQLAVSASTGYGKVKFRGRPLDAHRAMWIATNGQIEDGLFVMHSCDNRRCVRIEHLSLGTQAQNMQDASRKGRVVAVPHLGEASPKAKLTTQQVVEIKKRIAGGEQLVEIARDLPVTYSALSKIKRGVSWSRALAEVGDAA